MEDIDFSRVEFEWHSKKNEYIKRIRGLSFDEIAEKIRQGVLDVLNNREEFEGQEYKEKAISILRKNFGKGFEVVGPV